MAAFIGFAARGFSVLSMQGQARSLAGRSLPTSSNVRNVKVRFMPGNGPHFELTESKMCTIISVTCKISFEKSVFKPALNL